MNVVFLTRNEKTERDMCRVERYDHHDCPSNGIGIEFFPLENIGIMTGLRLSVNELVMGSGHVDTQQGWPLRFGRSNKY